MGDIGENGEYLPVRSTIYSCTSKKPVESNSIAQKRQRLNESTNSPDSTDSNLIHNSDSTCNSSVSAIRSKSNSNSNKVPSTVQTPPNATNSNAINSNAVKNQSSNLNFSTSLPTNFSENSTSTNRNNSSPLLSKRNSVGDLPTNDELDLMLYLELLKRQEQREILRIAAWNKHYPWKYHNDSKQAKY